MANDADSYGYHTPPEQQEYNDAIYSKTKKIAARPSPSYSTQAKGSGAAVDLVHHETPGAHNVVGEVQWGRDSGHVTWMGVEEGHRHMTPKLMAAAKDHADTHGYAPPLHSDIMSGDSYKIAKKYAPEHIPEDAQVNSRPLSLDIADVHKMKEHVNVLHSAALASSTPYDHEEINTHAYDAHKHLTDIAKTVRTLRPEQDEHRSYYLQRLNLEDSMNNLKRFQPTSQATQDARNQFRKLG